MSDQIGLDRAGVPLDGIDALLVEIGRTGRGAGAGFYAYPHGARNGIEDPEVEAIIAAERERKGLYARAVPDDEIRRRAFAAMANAGARLVETGVALRPSDVDVAMINGFGFPRHVGGPMQWADEEGPLMVREDLRRWQAEAPELWTPSALWDDLVKTGRRFGEIA
jgi:3-hydroxyacyl-CoA dehydrogenase